MRALVLGILLLFAVGCAAEAGPIDHAWGDDDVDEVVQEVTCAPALARYPVKGPHNGGWDPNALTYTCPAHPSHAKDNSDFIGGDHYGNDIFAAKGTPMVAPVSGTVIKAGWNTVGGNRVTIQDGCGWSYYHAHLDQISVVQGQKVSAGQQIGTVGNTGNASGTSPHLHFSVYPGVYEQGIDPFPLLQAVDGTSCANCKAHCEGSVIVGSDCGKGDCAAYGATCVDDALGVRCASVFCPTVGTKKVCVNDKLIGDCKDGAISTGDCSAYGSGCVDDAKGARCVVVWCLDAPSKAHDTCIPNGELVHCDDKGGFTTEQCPANEPCTKTATGAQCGAPAAGSGGASGGTGGSSGGGATGGASSGGKGGAPSGGGSAGSASSAGAGWGGGAEIPKLDGDGASSDPVEGGCACSTRRRHSGAGAWWMVLGVALLARRRTVFRLVRLPRLRYPPSR